MYVKRETKKMNCGKCEGEGKQSFYQDSGIIEEPCKYCQGYGFILWNEANAAIDLRPTLYFYYGEQPK